MNDTEPYFDAEPYFCAICGEPMHPDFADTRIHPDCDESGWPYEPEPEQQPMTTAELDAWARGYYTGWAQGYADARNGE